MTYTLLINGAPKFRGLTAEEADALVRTAREFAEGAGWGHGDSGARIDVLKETRTKETK